MANTPENERRRSHGDMLPAAICPAFLMKHILAHALDEVVHDDRSEPGDGHYWCAKTCTCIGPDDDYATPGSCLPGRGCYDGPQL